MPDRAGNGAYVDARDTGCAFGYETGRHAWGTSLVPERFDAVVESSEYCCEYISPVSGVGRVFTGCRRVWWRVEVLTSVVIIWVAVPATVPRSAGLVLLGIVNAEVVGLEPPNMERRTRDAVRKVAEVVRCDDCSRCICGSGFDAGEASTSSEVCGDPIEKFRINGTTIG